MALQFGLLGPLEVRRADRIVAVPRRKHRALLAVLLLRPGKVVSSDRLIEELWGEQPPRTAKDALQNYVSLLRKELGADVLATRDSGYVLNVEPDQIDLGRFDQLTGKAERAATAAECAAKLREALGLWRGPPLADLAFEPFAALEIARLEEQRLAARTRLIDAELELGRHAELVVELEVLIEEHPYDERLRGQLMLALYRAGRQADALEAYRTTHSVLVDELGIEPSPPLRELEQAILHQDPALGAPSALPVGARASRRTVTVLIASLVDATSRADELDPESFRAVFDRNLVVMRAVVERHGGTVGTFIGDAVMATFGAPQTHEDDALRAVRAAIELRDSFVGFEGWSETRIGVNTGQVISGGPDALVTGATVNIARRLEQAAPLGEILIGASTLRLVRDAVRAEPTEPLRRGESEPVPAFRLLETFEGAPGLARRLDAPLIGREDELEGLRRAFAEARDEGRCLVRTVLGEAGIGKTRLARELLSSVEDEAMVLVGRCVSYGEGATYLPLAEMIGEDFAILLASAGSTGEVFLAVRRRFEELAANRTLVLLFEDVHWAEPTLLDLTEYLGEQAVGPILVLRLARPELAAEQPGWKGDGMVVLEPLLDEEAQALLAAFGSEVRPELGARIVEIAEGNPLYVEQLLAHVEEAGEDALVAVPGSIEALLASRLDRLDPHAHALVRRAAIVGREFSREAVAALGPTKALPGLVQARLVQQADGEYRFHHVLVRDVVYAETPKAERAELHVQHAGWLDDAPNGADELVGFHLEQAVRCLTELGTSDPRVGQLSAAAGTRLAMAGIVAWKRGDAPATVNLLGRATALLPKTDWYRLELMCELGGALRTAGELGRAESVLAEASETAGAASGRRVELRARLELANLKWFTDPEGRGDELLSLAATAIPVFESLTDDRSLARTWFFVASIHGNSHCHYSAAQEAGESALLHYRRSGWPSAACLGNIAASLFYGPTPVAEALRECQSLVTGTDMNAEANVLPFVAGLEAMRGDFGRARELLGRAASIYQELGQAPAAEYSCGAVEHEVELLAGDESAAEERLRASCAALEKIGDRSYLATRAIALADLLCRQQRDDEAARWAECCEQRMPADDLHSQIPWRGVRARLAARQGAFAQAEALAREAVSLGEVTDALVIRARAWLDLGEVLRLAGQPADAAEAASHALDLLVRKGNAAATGQVQSILLELASTQ